MNPKLKKILKILAYTASSMLMVFMFLVFLLRFSFVQRQLVPPIEKVVSSAVGTEVEVGGLFLEFPMRAALNNLVIYDQQREVMAEVKAVKVSLMDVPVWRLVFGSRRKTHELSVSRIDVMEPQVYIYKQRRDSVMNIDFLLATEEKEPEKPKRHLRIELSRINLLGGAFTYVDSTKSDSLLALSDMLNFSHIRARDINGRLSVHMDSHQNLKAEVHHLHLVDKHSGMILDTLKTEFWAWTGVYHADVDTNRPFIMARDLLMTAGKTRLELDALLYDEDFEHLTDTTFDEHVYLRFHPSTLDFYSLKYFTAGGVPLEGVVGFQGLMTGSLNELASEEMNISYLDTTRINATVTLTDYLKTADMYMDIDLHDNSHVSYAELKKLLPDTDIPLNGTVNIDGRLRGTLDYLKSNNLKVRYGKETALNLDLRLDNYTRTDELLIFVKFKDSQINIAEIHSMVPEIEIPPTLYNFGKLQMDGRFTGTLTQFKIKADFISQFGNIFTNLNLIMPPDRPDITYSGTLKTENLNYDTIAVEDVFQSSRLNFAGTVDGSGTHFFDMNTKVSGQITNSDLFGYDIDTLLAENFIIKDTTLNGKIVLRDRQGHADLDVKVDRGQARHDYKLRGYVGDLDLTHYKVSPDSTPLLYSSIVIIRISGDSVENFEGKASLININLNRPHNGQTLDLQDFVLTSDKNTPTSKHIEVASSVAKVVLGGNFSFSNGAKLFQRLAYEGELYFRNVDSLIYKHYNEKVLDSVISVIDMDINPQSQSNEVLAFFGQKLWISDSSNFNGHFEFGEFDQAEVEFSSDTVRFMGREFYNNEFNANIIKDGSRNDVLIGSGDLEIGEVIIDKALSFQEVKFEPILNNNEVEYTLSGKQADYDNFFKFNALTEFFGNGVFTKVNPSISHINLHGQQWVIDQKNEIFIDGTSIQIENLQLSNGKQRIAVNGQIGNDPTEALKIQIDSLDIGAITDVYHLPIPLSGVIDSLGIQAFNLYGNPKAFAQGRLENFSYGKVDSVNILLKGFWHQKDSSNLATLNGFVRYRGERVLSLFSRYNFNDTISPIHVRSKASNFPLYFVEPFVEEFVEIPSGLLRIDTFQVDGNFDDLNVQGVGHFEDTEFHVHYLNNNFRLGKDTKVRFDRDNIIFPNITLLDTAGKKALLNGTIKHNGFQTFNLDLQVTEIKDFLFMTTSKKDNDLFYGTVKVKSGMATITGTDTLIDVTADVEVGEGSEFSIPLDGYETADRPDFVQFTEKSGKVKVKDKVDLGGFVLELNVTTTPEATGRLIFDETVGDEIEVSGDGKISLKITDDGNFTMFGSYENMEGEYLFTTYNVYNKKFKIRKGRIDWEGDPYEAILDLEATNTVRASLGDLLGTDNNTKIPVTIIMKMNGPLSKPIISLELDVPTDYDGAAGIMDYLSNIENDEQEMNRQVVSLLVFRRFAPSHSTFNGAGFVSSGLTSTVSELISNQVNNWLSEAFDDNFGLELSTNSENEVDLALRASLFDDKVTVERNGTLIGDKTSQVTIGDISVHIKLLPRQYSSQDSNYIADPSRGQLVVEIFNRESANMTSVRNSYTTGGGIFYKKDFDRLSELFRKRDEKLHPRMEQ